MPVFLSDPPPALYLVLFLGVIVAASVWFRYQSRTTRWVAIGVLVLLLVMCLIDRVTESPREQAVRRVEAIVAAVNARQPNDLLPHVSDSFDYRGLKKSNLSSVGTWQIIRDHNVRVAVWDFARDDVQFPDANTAVVGFMSKGGANGREVPFYIRAKFVRDADGEWRVQSFTAYDPLQKANGTPVSIPGMP